MSYLELVKLSEYKKYGFDIPFIDLDFVVQDDHVIVTNTMTILPSFKSNQPLTLKGDNIQLISISINGEFLSEEEYLIDQGQLNINYESNNAFKLKISNKLDPAENNSLQGLYLSKGMLTTQCEAEGFRKITYHPDRPDVLSKYRVRIEADICQYPILISNGNKTFHSKLEGNSSRHQVLYVDPHPKPSYLFALVACDLAEVKDTYKTKSGRNVALNLYVEEDEINYIDHAIDSLKRAMKWDEDEYGLEYDLDEFNIVAVRHFNMGAMENKGLNIFNSKLVMADSTITTDDELERIESVIAHEYFHNWTGNRITCRDWFQLSLKEGLTVFRDQSFTSDLHSEAIKRIDDVCLLRNQQFREDAGPTAHAVKPVEYRSIDNFYTTTIYEKGAELIRMLKTLVGNDNFKRGFNLYVDTFDGSAATTEDFTNSIFSFSEISKTDIQQFNLWYYQAGTPELTIKRFWDPSIGQLKIRFSQKTRITPGQEVKSNMIIPIRLAVIQEENKNQKEQLFILRDKEEELVIDGLLKNKQTPNLSLLRDFSSPVKMFNDLSDDEHLQLLRSDDNSFSRWESGQNLFRKLLLYRADKKPIKELENKMANVLSDLIKNIKSEDPYIMSALLSFPSISELELWQETSDPIALYDSILDLKRFLGEKLDQAFFEIPDQYTHLSTSAWPAGQGERRLRGKILSFKTLIDHKSVFDELISLINGPSMTLSIGALEALKPIESYERELAFKAFFDRWNKKPIILDTWFRLESSAPRKGAIKRIKELLKSEYYDAKAPNSIRAILGGLASNPKAFHSEDGVGYKFMAEQILEIDSNNPITASRIAKVFIRHKSYAQIHRTKMKEAINLLSGSNLSSNTREVVDLMI